MKNVRLTTELFIAAFKSCYENSQVTTAELNEKSRLFLSNVGLLQSDMMRYVIDYMKPDNYYRGPTPHHRFPNRKVMEFGMPFGQYDLYVKVELIEHNGEYIGGYMSFHPEERPIDFVLRQEGDV